MVELAIGEVLCIISFLPHTYIFVDASVSRYKF